MFLAIALAVMLQTDSGGVLLPCEVPFECATDVRVANATATWKLSFDRRWPGIYDIVHWDIRYTDGRRAEYLAHLVRPAEGKPYYRFLVHERRGVWYTLGIRKRWVWRDVPSPSAEQDAMTVRLRQLFGIAQYLREGANPADVRF